SLLEKVVGFIHGTDPRDPHLLDQTVLKGAEESFHSTFGLRGQRDDELDLERLESPADDRVDHDRVRVLTGFPRSMGAAPVPEMAGPVGVERPHPTMLAQVIGQDLSIRQPRVPRVEPGEDLTGRIIDHRDEAQLGSSALLPVMLRAVNQDHLASCLSTPPAAAVHGTMAVDRSEALLDEPQAEGTGVDPSTLGMTGEVLAQKGRHKVLVQGIGGHLPGACPKLGGKSPIRRDSSPSMKHGGVSIDFPPSSHPT